MLLMYHIRIFRSSFPQHLVYPFPNRYLRSNVTSRQYLTRGLGPSLFAYNNSPILSCGGEAVNSVGAAMVNGSTSSASSSASKQCGAKCTIIKSNLTHFFYKHVQKFFQHQGPQYRLTKPSFSFSTRPSYSQVQHYQELLSISRRFTHTLSNVTKDATKLVPIKPTKKELLSRANGFLPRLKIHIQYALMRQVRPWTADDIFALFSWIFLSHTLFIAVGTTTFVSVVLALANSLQVQEFIAYRVSEYLTSQTGMTVRFESAIVPNWKEGRISFRNVSISQGPIITKVPNESKQESEQSHSIPEDAAGRQLRHDEEDDDECQVEVDNNLTMFDVTVEQIEVTLSFMRWLDGKSLVKDCTLKGVRGNVDRQGVWWDPNEPWDPISARRQHEHGDFEIETFVVEDLLVTL
ncbi:Mitochondrial distribution and morphology protein 31, mitochondrial precursor, partial [Basidiobolus ranarum]